MSLLRSTAAAAALAACAGAHAHVVLDRPSAPAGSYHKATFMVGHGCEGSPTRRLTVFVPDGIVSVKPMARPGWTVQTRSAALPAPATLHGKTITKAVSQVSWSGGPLPDDRFDEFTMLVRLPAQPGRLHFRILQECERGQVDWADVGGSGGARSKTPAAVLDVLPAAGSAAAAIAPASVAPTSAADASRPAVVPASGAAPTADAHRAGAHQH